MSGTKEDDCKDGCQRNRLKIYASIATELVRGVSKVSRRYWAIIWDKVSFAKVSSQR